MTLLGVMLCRINLKVRRPNLIYDSHNLGCLKTSYCDSSDILNGFLVSRHNLD